MTGEEVLSNLLASVPGASAAAVPVKGYPTVRLASSQDLPAAVKLLKEELGFDYLEMITAVDWLGPVELKGYIPASSPLPFTAKPPAPPVTPVPGPGIAYRPVLDLLWSFGNLRENLKIFLRLEIPRGDFQVPSLVESFPAADWQEREVFDLFGVRFAGHPHLIKILTPDFLQGHPLLKDYVHQPDEFDAD
jgi:NADH:ubiquinone oxidoreductase subunit C